MSTPVSQDVPPALSPESVAQFKADQASSNRSERSKLTEEEKNRNHLNSEHKRRTNIRTSMEMLCELVPGLEGKAAAEGEVLEKAVAFIEKQIELNKIKCKEAEARGEHVPEWKKMYLGHSGIAPGGRAPSRPTVPLTEFLPKAREWMKAQDEALAQGKTPPPFPYLGGSISDSPRSTSNSFEDEGCDTS